MRGGVVLAMAGMAVADAGAAGAADVAAQWPADGEMTPPLISAAQAAIQRDRAVMQAPRRSATPPEFNRVIAVPLREGDVVIGAVALAVQAADSAAVDRLCKRLAHASGRVVQRLQEDRAAGQSAGPSEADSTTASSQIEALAFGAHAGQQDEPPGDAAAATPAGLSAAPHPAPAADSLSVDEAIAKAIAEVRARSREDARARRREDARARGRARRAAPRDVPVLNELAEPLAGQARAHAFAEEGAGLRSNDNVPADSRNGGGEQHRGDASDFPAAHDHDHERDDDLAESRDSRDHTHAGALDDMTSSELAREDDDDDWQPSAPVASGADRHVGGRAAGVLAALIDRLRRVLPGRQRARDTDWASHSALDPTLDGPPDADDDRDSALQDDAGRTARAQAPADWGAATLQAQPGQADDRADEAGGRPTEPAVHASPRGPTPSLPSHALADPATANVPTAAASGLIASRTPRSGDAALSHPALHPTPPPPDPRSPGGHREAAPSPVPAATIDRADVARPHLDDAGRVLLLQDTLLRHSRLSEGALAMATELAAMLDGAQVALAVTDGDDLSLLALSHTPTFEPDQSLLRQVTAAMHEAADQGARVSFPATPGQPARIVLAHAQLQQHTGQAITSVPLVKAQQVCGALQVQWPGASAPAEPVLAFIDSVACAIGPLVALGQAAEAPWWTRARAALRQALQRLRQRDDPAPKAIVAGSVLALAVLTLWPTTYRVAAPARIEGLVQRVVAAPTDGFLNKSHVRPGDSVQAGQLLVELADQDLRLEERRWEGALAQHENGVAAALARSDRAQFVIMQGRAGEARAQLELVRQQLARTKLTAPIAGVIIKGDLSQALGAPVKRGDALMTLSPAGQFRLIVEVDERDVADVRAGQGGHLALSALPINTMPFVVERVTPVATVHEGRNAFEVEARLEAAALPALRPGLQGVARIEAGERSLAWIWGHRVWQALRMAWWSWGL